MHNILALTFLNLLIFHKSLSLSIIGRDKCQAKCESCSTGSSTDDLKCGSDGVTYFNLCELKCAGRNCNLTLTVLHDGICSDPLNNGDQLSPENISADHSEPTETTPGPAQHQQCDPFQDCTCNFDLLFVCGSDHQTYPNECALKCATRCNADLKILHYGTCQ